ncbi:mitochondrial 54S ribosomal protein YmL31 [Thermoascus aurantiacus ATCC 26904]
MFKPTSPLLGGLLWKIPWRLSRHQKARQRKRLRHVDKIVDTVSAALERNGISSIKSIKRWYSEMPREEEMLPKDKYTIFDKKERTYRKSIRKLPKWTRVSQRVNPPGF